MSERMGRREFLKTLLGGVAVAGTLGVGEARGDTREDFKLISREQWDDSWQQIKTQYDRTIGDTVSFNVDGQAVTRTVDVLPYLNPETLKPEDLKKVYCRLVVHHTAIAPDKKTDPTIEARAVRNIEIQNMNFNDVGYHFLIASDGTVLEGRPIDRIGSHAGISKESIEQKKQKFPSGVGVISEASRLYQKLVQEMNTIPDKPENRSKIQEKRNECQIAKKDYLEKLKTYVKIMKMDPDYGSIGVVLCGNFEGVNKPTQAQLIALVKLSNQLKTRFDIPSNNLLYHKEVREQVVEASGLTPDGPKTVCPGSAFVPKDTILSRLAPDTPNAKSKKVLLDLP